MCKKIIFSDVEEMFGMIKTGSVRRQGVDGEVKKLTDQGRK